MRQFRAGAQVDAPACPCASRRRCRPAWRRSRARRDEATSSCAPPARAAQAAARRARPRPPDRSSAAPARRSRARRAACRPRACRRGRCRAASSSWSVVCAWKANSGPVALLELERRRPTPRSRWPLIAADPAALREDHRDRLALDHRLQRNLARRRRLRRWWCGACRARCPRRIALAQLGEILLEPRALARGAVEQLGQALALLVERVALLARSPSPRAGASERSRMLRIASAWRSVSANSAIITGLGSSSVRMISITRSRLR